MSEANGLPKGWTITIVGQIAKSIQYGHTASATDDPSGPRFLRITDIQNHRVDWDAVPSCEIPSDELQKYRLQSGDIVFARTGATTGKSYLIRDCPEAVFASYLIRLRMHEGVFPPFVQAYFQTNNYWRQIEGGKRGIGQPNVNATVLGTIRLPVAPPNEQRRIVEKIEELFSDLDAGVAALERAKANLKRYRAAVLKAAVEGKLTAAWRAEHPDVEPASKLLERILAERRRKWEADQLAKFSAVGKPPPKNWRAKYVEPAPPDTTNLPELPKGWCWATLGQLLHGIEGGKSFKCLTRKANLDEWGVVKVSAMTWGTFLEDEQKAIPPGATFDAADEVRPNDLLLSRSNTTELVGATVLVGNCRPRLLLSDKSLRLLISAILDRRWLHRALSSSVVRRQLSSMATGTSDSMRNVSQEKIESVVIPLPTAAEQSEIAAAVAEKLSEIEAAEVAIDHGLHRAARLRQSILKRAFEGKLVPQDPRDEPASALLERIKEKDPTARSRRKRKVPQEAHA